MDTAIYKMTDTYRMWISSFTIIVDYKLVMDKGTLLDCHNLILELPFPPESMILNLSIIAGEMTSIVKL